MTSYTITNTTSGATIGTYEGVTEADALDAMARDQGYESHADMLATIESDGSDIRIEEVEAGTIEVFLDTDRYSIDPEGSLSDDAYAANCNAYADAVREAVVEAYPHASVTVRTLRRGGTPGVNADGFDDNDTVKRTVKGLQQDVWDAADFWIHEGA